MKLRIHKNSIRIRVNRAEVERLAGGEALEERLLVGPRELQCLDYSLVPKALPVPGAPLHVDLGRNNLRIYVEPDAVLAWHGSEKLEIEACQEWEGGVLRILLEKDMERLNKKQDEDKSGLYPNPLFGKARCVHP